jgi:integrase
MSLNRLTALAAKALTADGRHADGGGLYLQIKNGGRSWLFMYRDRATHKLREMGLGPCSDVTLSKARVHAAEARDMLRRGIDPLSQRREQRAKKVKTRTFGPFATEFIKSIVDGFKNEKHRDQWASSIKTYAKPLWSKPLHEITIADVHRVLAPIWAEKHETATRVRGRLERIFDAAKASGLRSGDNPAAWKGALKPMLQKTKKARRHHPAIPYADMPAFLVALRKHTSLSAKALEFTILTCARTNETIGIKTSEINWAEKIWTVPAERMKRPRAHRVPLTDRALAILKSVTPQDGFYFPLSNMAQLECMRGLRKGVTVHGCRTSFRDWAGDETNFSRDLAEEALAHAIKDETEASYRRSDALKKRRALMDAWAGYLAAERGHLVATKR